MKILLIEGNARQVLPMAKSLRELGHEVTTYNSSKTDYGYTSRYPHRKLIAFFNLQDEPKTLRTILNELAKYPYDLVIPMNDDAAIVLSRHKTEIETYTRVAVNDWSIFKLSMDKLETMRVCMEHKIPCPITLYDLTEYFDAGINQIKFPLVVKPRVGCGAVGFHVAKNEEDLKSYYHKATVKYGPCLIQEYIPQTDYQYKCEIYIDREGEMKSAVVFAKVRWYPINGGSSTLNVTVKRRDIVDSCEKLLKIIGWRGYADIDLIQDPRDGKAKIIEINPRITGSVKICFKAGVNFSQQITEDFCNETVTPMTSYKEGIYLRYIQKDILWLLKSPNRFNAKPSWFSFNNTIDQIWDWSDPIPFLISSIESLNKLRKDSKKRRI